MHAGNQQVAAPSPTPFLVRAMIFSKSGWERRRGVGKRRFVARMTLIGCGAGAMLVTSTLLSALRAGQPFNAVLRGSSLVLLVSGFIAPLVLRSVAGLEWRLLEDRYARELAKEGRSPSRVPADSVP